MYVCIISKVSDDDTLQSTPEKRRRFSEIPLVLTSNSQRNSTHGETRDCMKTDIGCAANCLRFPTDGRKPFLDHHLDHQHNVSLSISLSSREKKKTSTQVNVKQSTHIIQMVSLLSRILLVCSFGGRKENLHKREMQLLPRCHFSSASSHSSILCFALALKNNNFAHSARSRRVDS